MRRLCNFIIVLSLMATVLCTPVFADAGVEVMISDVQVEAGETAGVSVDIAGNTGLAAWMFEITWDSGVMMLDKDSITLGKKFSSGTMLVNDSEEGKLVVTWFSVKNVAEDGQLLSVDFLTDENAVGSHSIQITCSEGNTIDAAGRPVQVAASDGSVIFASNERDEVAVPSRPEPKPEEDSKPTFSDVAADRYYYDAVTWAAESGITTGTSALLFSPNAICTRAQTVTFLWRAAGCPEPEADTPLFKDVRVDSYYGKAVAWAVEQGITTGTAKDTFNPGGICTRAQVVTFLWRAAGSKSAQVGAVFADVPAGKYYTDAVSWAVENGITMGITQSAFAPHASCTRAQIVTFLYRYFA